MQTETEYVRSVVEDRLRRAGLVGEIGEAARRQWTQQEIDRLNARREGGIGDWNRKALSRMSRNPNTRAFSSRT